MRSVFKASLLVSALFALDKVVSLGVQFLVARAYGVLASGGLRSEPTTVRAVVDANGTVLTRTRPRATRVMDPEVAYLVT